MRILASQNLYGYWESDGHRVTALHRVPVLANGLCTDGGLVYLADWADVHILNGSGTELETVHTRAVNCHTVRRHRGKTLLAGTGNSAVVWGDEVVFRPGEFGFRPQPPHGFYVNAAIPWRRDTVLIGLRSHRAVVFFDVKERCVERVVPLPFLRNLHHPTPFGEFFLVSDDASVVLFDIEGRAMLRSPEIRWPRGIWVESRTRVWVADRRGIRRWNPQTNAIERSVDSPLPPPSSLPERKGDVQAGALFDVVGVGD